jgi:hypothetical protein
MVFEQLASSDYERAVSRGFFRKVLNKLTGTENKLLPFDEVRARLPMSGQSYRGLKQVEIDKIVGSFGRYLDFDRVFLPIQRTTKDRWVSINKAHYQQIPLPPVELYKIGEIYFVKDGNHRISVARQRGQIFIDAFVTEINTPVRLSPDLTLRDLDMKRENALFMEKTKLNKSRPDAEIEFTVPGLAEVALNEIENHCWYLGECKKNEVSFEEATISWYDQVYQPLVEQIREHNLVDEFKGSSEADLCLWTLKYRKYLSQASASDNVNAEAQALHQLIGDYPLPAVKKLSALIKEADWLNEITLQRERAHFLNETQIINIRPEALIKCTLPGMYYRLLEHISVHRWYLGIERGSEVSFSEAVSSWYDHVYMPLIQVIHEQDILKDFPKRTETDLYLWIIQHQWHLRETYGSDIPISEAVEDFSHDFSKRPLQRFFNRIKNFFGIR